MVTCTRCGKEFKSKPEASVPGRLPYLIRYPLRIVVWILAALFIIGGLIWIGTYVATAFADYDFSLQILSIAALFMAIFTLMALVFRNWLQSRASSRYCPDCAIEIPRDVF